MQLLFYIQGKHTFHAKFTQLMGLSEAMYDKAVAF
jgi:hypothetical protein